MKKPYIFIEDRTFICDPFECEFTDVQGKKHKGNVSGASIDIAAFYVKKVTHEPVYSCRDDDRDEDGLSTRYFTATVDPVYGAVVIPYYDNMRANELTIKGLEIACKIDGYSVDYQVSEGIADVICVDEKEFTRIVTENYEKFNITDNYSGQSTAFGAREVKKLYPRNGYKVGYDKDGKVVAVPYEDGKKIKEFYSAADSKEKAEEYKKDLEGISLEKFKEVFNDYFYKDHKECGTFAKALAACRA